MGDCSIDYFRTLCKLKPKQIEQVRGYYKQVWSENEHLKTENARLKTALDEITHVKEDFEECLATCSGKRIDRLTKILGCQMEEIDRLKEQNAAFRRVLVEHDSRLIEEVDEGEKH